MDEDKVMDEEIEITEQEIEAQEPDEEDIPETHIEVVAVKEILESVKIDTSSPDILDTKTKKGSTLSGEELYAEFIEFVEQKIDMVPDKGFKQVIPTGIDVLDAILGGGFAIGALNIVVGQPGSGKSMLAIQSMGNGQHLYNKDGFFCAYLDSENATTTSRMSNLGIRSPEIKPFSDITVERVFKFIETVCLYKDKKGIKDKPSMIVWDSIANSLSQKERETEDVNSVIGYRARMFSILIPSYVPKLAEYNICLVAINQLRDVIAMGPFQQPRDLKFLSSSKDMPGGTVIKYNAFQLMELKVKGQAQEEKHGFNGIICSAKCAKNKLFSPNIEVQIIGDFVNGFSNFYTNYQLLVSSGRLKTGAWNYLVNLPTERFRTRDAKAKFNDSESFRDAFNEAIKDAINCEIIEKGKQ